MDSAGEDTVAETHVSPEKVRPGTFSPGALPYRVGRASRLKGAEAPVEI